MNNSKIRHIATSYDGDFFAVAEFEHNVQVWNLWKRKKICEFSSIMDFGGKRLAISENGRFCAVGAYDKLGMAVYDAQKGSLKWQRKDLKKILNLEFDLDGNRLMAFNDRRVCHFLNIKKGNSLNIERDLISIKNSPFNKIILLEKIRSQEIVDSANQKLIGELSRITFAVLDSVFTEDSVIISESGGPVSSYAFDGKLIWQYNPEPGNHILNLAYNESINEVLGVEWPYDRGGEKRLIHFNKKSGNINREYPIEGNPADLGFAKRGTFMITSNGNLYDTTFGKIIHYFDF